MNNTAHPRKIKLTPRRISTRRVQFYLLAAIHQVSSTSLPSSQPFHLSQCIKQRCDDKLALWIYEGTLADHDTGRIVADVEGVELVGSLQCIDADQNKSDDYGWLENYLSVGKLLREGDGWDSASTILSRKLFCYKRRPGCNTNILDGRDKKLPNELLTSIRLRPDGPIRRLSPSESTSVYDSAITFISRGPEFAVFSERSGDANERSGKPVIIGTVQPSEMSEHDIEYTIHARKSSEEPRLPTLRSKEEMTISPQRSRLIQFGKSEETGRKHDGVRETYTYSFGNMQQAISSNGNDAKSRFKWLRRFEKDEPTLQNPQQHTVRYTRYGEAPPWYAPGRMCTLDLIGKRVNISQKSNDGILSFDSVKLPPLMKWSVGKCNPSFWSGWPSEMLSRKDGGSDFKALELFCTEDPRCITYAMDREQSRMRVRAEHILSKLQKGSERLKESLLLYGAQRVD